MKYVLQALMKTLETINASVAIQSYVILALEQREESALHALVVCS